MCGFACGVTTLAVGAVLVVVCSIVGYAVIPGIIDDMIINEMVLIDDTIQYERFEEVPFPLNFTVRVWNISNPEEVLSGGIPIMTEAGPYVYRLRQSRLIDNVDEDLLWYRRLEDFTFDPESSYPNTEDDRVTVVNVPYHAILQVAENLFPTLMPVLNTAINGIFGQYNGPIMEVRVRDLLFDGLPICENPGLVGAIACAQVRELSEDAQNIAEQEDGSLLFSILAYKDSIPGPEHVVYRGLNDSNDLGRITLFNGFPRLFYWTEGDNGEQGVCNTFRGTDSGIFPPFVNRDQSLYALNTDICRSVELRHQYDLEFKGVPAVRYAANEWFLNNDEGCYCLNVTTGLSAEDGCLLRGTNELYTCVGAYLVLSYPHFLYADFMYQNGVIGMNPNVEDHRIFVDLEPNTGTVIAGAKRAQFNIFMRPISGITATQNLRTTLTPIVWVEEGMTLPDEFVDELSSRLLLPLTLVDILVPIVIALSAVVLVVGAVIAVRARSRKSDGPILTSTPLPSTAADTKTT